MKNIFQFILVLSASFLLNSYGWCGMDVLWTLDKGISGLAIGDLNGDNEDEIVAVIQNQGKICSYNWAGNNTSCFNIPYDIRAIRLSDIDGDGQLEIVGFRVWGQTLFVLDGNGNTIWEFNDPTIDAIDDVAVFDVDGDGKKEIAIGFNGGTGLYLLNFDGTIRWKYNKIGNVWHVCGGDINGDGTIEVVSLSAYGYIHIFEDQHGLT